MIGLSLIGPTGSGKSTVARHIEEAFGAEIVKVAKPLYDLQGIFYSQVSAILA